MNGDACNPLALMAGPYDGSGYNVLPTDTGLSSSTKIGGFKFRTCLEDIARATASNTNTTTTTNFTSRLISFTIQGSPLPINIESFDVNAKIISHSFHSPPYPKPITTSSLSKDRVMDVTLMPSGRSKVLAIVVKR